MKPLYIVGNWKSNKTWKEAEVWLNGFSEKLGPQKEKVLQNNLTIVVCVPFPVLLPFKEKVAALGLPIRVGAQNVSSFADGAYTGEVSARQLSEAAEYVIIGHSERRKYFHETEEVLGEKVAQAKGAGLKVIYCVQDDLKAVPQGVDIVGYEPFWAIGTGNADTPENANGVVSRIKERNQVPVAIYGGSVTPDNVRAFVSVQAIDGVLPGGASLDPDKFFGLISHSLPA